MRKFAFGAAFLLMIAGIVGFTLRHLYLTRAVEADTGLPVLSSPSLLAMVFYTAFIIVLAFAISFVVSRRFVGEAEYHAIIAPVNLVYRTITGVAAVLIFVSGVIGVVSAAIESTISYPMLIRAILLLLTGISLIGLAHEGSGKKALRGAYVFSIIPEIAMTFWLLFYYRSTQTNPTLLSYVFFALALAASAFAFYFTAAYVYGRKAPLRFIFSHSAAVYFLIMSLADGIALRDKLCFIGLALYFIVNLTHFIGNLVPQKRKLRSVLMGEN